MKQHQLMWKIPKNNSLTKTLRVLLLLFLAMVFVFNSAVYTNADTPKKSKTQGLNSISAIKEACKNDAVCQEDVAACGVDIENAHNPYDVEWDYGEKWQEYVDNCDWSLVFDVKFYKKEFPMLAIQYHNDDQLLLEHFQTVGVHEGRQGCKNFNVDAYRRNCSQKIYDEFKNDIEGFYLYYMLNYDTEKKVNTVTANSKKKITKLIKIQLTAVQQLEFDGVNEIRENVGAGELKTNAEFNAFANYRAYVQRESGYGMDNKGHEWARQNNDIMYKYTDICFPEDDFILCENTITSQNNIRPKSTYYIQYKNHKEHYEAMIDKRNLFIGISNCYYSKSTNTASQYDLFVHTQ